MHYVYSKADSEFLEQGDVLKKTDELVNLINTVHPHYSHDNYTHFMVLTQSCDLVKRKNSCKAKYITLACVRPLELAIDREMDQYRGELEIRAGVCSSNKKSKIEDFLRKLIDNNHPDYFFLQKDDETGFQQNSCVFLRLSISIRAFQHYEKCLNARCLGLNDVFKAKLGWLVGNIYSRVGTPDWIGKGGTSSDLKHKIEDILESNYKWYSYEMVAAAKKHIKDDELLKLDKKELRSKIEEVEYTPASERQLDRIVQYVFNIIETGNVTKETLKDQLSSQPDIKRLR